MLNKLKALLISGAVVLGAQGYADLIDAQKAQTAFKEFESRPEMVALRNLIFIVYDPIVGRPWQAQDYYPEAQKRWDHFRTLYCPQVKILCELGERIEGMDDVRQIAETIVQPQVIQALQSQVTQGSHFQLSHVRYLEQPQSGFYFWLSYDQQAGANTVIDVFGNTHQPNWKEKEYFLLYDPIGYRGGFFNDESRTLLTQDEADNSILINLDIVKNHALKFANRWKARTDKTVNPNDLDDVIFARLLKKHQPRFEAVAQALGEDPSSETVYQHVTYEIFRELAQLQAQYFSFASKERKDIDFVRQTWESGLHIQTQSDPVMFLYLMYNEASLEAGSILSQYLPRPIAHLYFYEIVKAIAGLGEYKLSNLAQYQYLFESKEAFDAEFLRTQVPAAYGYLSGGEDENLKVRYETLAPSEKTKFWQLYVGQKGLNTSAMYRLLASLVVSIDEKAGQEIALKIHDIRQDQFEARKLRVTSF